MLAVEGRAADPAPAGCGGFVVVVGSRAVAAVVVVEVGRASWGARSPASLGPASQGRVIAPSILPHARTPQKPQMLQLPLRPNERLHKKTLARVRRG